MKLDPLPLTDFWVKTHLNAILSVHRAEFDDNPRVYLKAVRCTLIALGCTPDYINGEFREWIESQFSA